MVMHAISRLLAIFTLVIVTGNVFAEITVRPDRNPVSMNESFKLTFDVTDGSGDDPDFSPLQKDFQILSTSQNSYYSMVNGQISSSKQWTLTLMATTSGKLQIPAISFGAEMSPVAEIEVEDDSSNTGGQTDEFVFLESSVSSQNPYVQSQVIYTLKLFRSVAIAKASLGEPVIGEGNAVLDRIDDDKTYETVIDGKSWQVIERNYAIYPQASDKVTIPPVSFMGQISRNAYGYDPFGPPPRTVVRRSAEQVLDVRAIPSTFSGAHWLPAKNLTLAEQWSVDPASLQLGQPVTRTLIMTANGLLASQLPELPAWPLTELKYYPDQPGLSDERSETGVTGTRSEKAAIIPNRPGKYVLPEISIPWWNITTDKLEYAVVPERTIEVMPGAAGANAPAAAPQPQAQQPVVTESVVAPAPAEIPAPDAVVVPVTTGGPWKWISAALLMLWISTVLMWWQKTRTVAASTTSPQAGKGKVDSVARQVLDACKQNDAAATRLSLLQWGKLAWPKNQPFSLIDIGARTSSEMAAEIKSLNDALYGKDSKSWSGENLARVFAVESARIVVEKKPGEPGKLEPLYRL
jgi:hypothetical protein